MPVAAGTDPGGSSMIFRHLFDPVSSTCTYVISDDATREAVIVDPVLVSSAIIQSAFDLDLRISSLSIVA